MIDSVRELFLTNFGQEPEVIARAPGRIEFIGNHTDYNGGNVMGVAIEQGISVALKRRADRMVRGATAGLEGVFECSLDNLEIRPKEPEWSRYPLGVLWACEQQGIHFDFGWDLVVLSNVPSGAGMSSSAALELATAYAVLELIQQDFSRKDIVRICRLAENQYVGVPCGILDQGVCGFGKKDQLVHIDCKSESFTNVPIPCETHFWIFNTDVKHSLIDSLYSERFAECGEGLAVAKGLYPHIECLVDIPLGDLDNLAEHLNSKVFRRVSHVLRENQRVKEMVECLGIPDVDLHACGNLLFESHKSSRDLFNNSTEELDFLVANLRLQQEVYGARLTGGGFGGAVMAWTSPLFNMADAEALKGCYIQRFDRPLKVLNCVSGDGARVIWKA